MDIVRWIGIAVLAIILLLGGRWIALAARSSEREQEQQKQIARMKQQQSEALTESGRREYVLEVIGIGVTLDKYRQGKLWDVLQTGSPYTSIREQDPKKYPWSDEDKGGLSGGRAYFAVENGASFTPMFWGMPSFYAGIPPANTTVPPDVNDPSPGLVAGAETAGMPMHMFAIAQWKLDERPDRLLEDVFAFFDAHPDVPYVCLTAEDSVLARNDNRPAGTPLLFKDGYYIPEMPDATVLMVLARRERVDPLRPYVWDDPGNKFVHGRLRAMYYDLMAALPSPEKLRNPKGFSERQPTVAEWLPAAAAFAKRPEIRGDGLHMLDNFNPWDDRPPRDWTPTPWFPIPWNREQMETFDRLPSFGFIHRPTFVRFVDQQGHPVTRRDQRQHILDAGWQQALLAMPDGERGKGPARVIAATGNQPEQLLALHGLLYHYAEQGGPEIDTGKLAQFIDTDRRLGNTGAATLFMQMALGVMGSYRAGGVSAAINLRDPGEASIIFITPPSDKVRHEQDQRGDIFRSRIVPAIDPGNYAAPSVEAMLDAKQQK